MGKLLLGGRGRRGVQKYAPITATDRTGLLADVTIKLSDMHIFIHSLNSREAGNGTAVVTATIDVMGRNTSVV